MNPNYWQNKVCVITGASSGLGRSIAHQLARRQARVVLVARNEQSLRAVADSLAASGADATPIVADVTQQNNVDRLARDVFERFNKIDLLCNCAGRSTRGRVLETSPVEFQKLLDINFLASVRTTQAFAESLLQHQGHLVQIGSLASKFAPRFLAGYPASKFALAAYSQQLRLELGPQGLHVLLVCPGPIARDDDAPRYADQSTDLPSEATKPGGGAKLRGIDQEELAVQILSSCERRHPELIVPRRARLLLLASAVSPRLGDWLLQKFTSG